MREVNGESTDICAKIVEEILVEEIKARIKEKLGDKRNCIFGGFGISINPNILRHFWIKDKNKEKVCQSKD